MKIYLDVDGVFADFRSAANKVWSTRDTDADRWMKLSQIPNFFLGLDLLPSSRVLFTALTKTAHDIEFLTALPRPTGHFHSADADKRAWIFQNLSTFYKVNTIVGGVNKYKFLGGNPGALLIDDTERNLIPWAQAGGKVILHTSVDTTLFELREMGVL